MMVWLPHFAALLLAASWADASQHCVPKRYNTTSSRVDGMLNVHLVPHTHDDAGWLKTVDQYFCGSNTVIQLAGVQYILDSVTHYLGHNKDRKFVYGEMAFFSKWWDQQNNDVRERVRQLVEDGQLDFVNGGWVQHDEAAAHYVAMIDQTTRGHQFLNRTFGKVPTVGWQIDPFGHSSTHASLLAGYLGLDAVFFGRSDYQDLSLRTKKQQLELLWRGSTSFGDAADVFTGSFASGNYGAPPGFMFDWGQPDEPIMDNICLTETNVGERVDAFVRACQGLANVTRGDDIMLTMGTDFTYSNAHVWFQNLDKLIHYTNMDGRVNVFYSTPAIYVEAKNAYNTTWPLKEDDFFPYADCPTCYWTGYFTSRPASKAYIRGATSYLQAARQVEFLARHRLGWSRGTSTDSLEEAVSLTQHHDAITGTEKQHVANDYHKRLAKGMAEAEDLVLAAMEEFVYGTGSGRGPPSGYRTGPSTHAPANGPGTLGPDLVEEAEHGVADGWRELPVAAASEGGQPGLLTSCALLNASVCAHSVAASRAGDPFTLVAYNPLAWPRTQGVRVPVVPHHPATAFVVTGPDGGRVLSQLLPISNATLTLQKLMAETGNLPNPNDAGTHELAFIVSLPPLGYAIYTVEPRMGEAGSLTTFTESAEEQWDVRGSENDVAAVETLNCGTMQVDVSRRTGNIMAMRTDFSAPVIELTTTVAWYNSSDKDGSEGLGSNPPSGAYIFRPNGVTVISSPMDVSIVQGPVVTEIRQVFLDWASLVTRVWNSAEHLEVEWTAGPIPIQDNKGKELVVRYTTNVSSGGVFYTDANGREMQRRVRNRRPTWDLNVTEPVSGNFYPLTAAMYIEGSGRQLAVVTERAQGGASLASGEMEVMLHRRTLLDDWRGVGEPINETMCGHLAGDCPGLVVRGTHLLSLQTIDKAAKHRRRLQQQANDPILLAFGPIPGFGGWPGNPEERDPGPMSAAAGAEGLPENVHLLTLKVQDDGQILLRLAHLFQKGEDASDLAQPVSVDLNAILDGVRFQTASEVALSAARMRHEVKRMEWQVGEKLFKAASDYDEGAAGDSNPLPDASGGRAATRTRQAPLSCHHNCAESALRVELNPMEIRTFLLTVASEPSQAELQDMAS